MNEPKHPRLGLWASSLDRGTRLHWFYAVPIATCGCAAVGLGLLGATWIADPAHRWIGLATALACLPSGMLLLLMTYGWVFRRRRTNPPLPRVKPTVSEIKLIVLGWLIALFMLFLAAVFLLPVVLDGARWLFDQALRLYDALSQSLS